MSLRTFWFCADKHPSTLDVGNEAEQYMHTDREILSAAGQPELSCFSLMALMGS